MLFHVIHNGRGRYHGRILGVNGAVAITLPHASYADAWHAARATITQIEAVATNNLDLDTRSQS